MRNLNIISQFRCLVLQEEREKLNELIDKLKSENDEFLTEIES